MNQIVENDIKKVRHSLAVGALWVAKKCDPGFMSQLMSPNQPHFDPPTDEVNTESEPE
jgi:hypothetical protein